MYICPQIINCSLIMRNYINRLTLVALLSLLLLSCSDNSFPPEQLPEKVTNFVAMHFPSQNIVTAQKQWGLLGPEYSVILSDSSRVSFDSNNVWDEVECPSSGIPSSMVPPQVADYSLRSNLSFKKILEIEKESYGFKVKLDEDVEVKLSEEGYPITKE